VNEEALALALGGGAVAPKKKKRTNQLSKPLIKLTSTIQLDRFHNFPNENEISAVGLNYEV
jgi:hypothetical protein